MATLAETLREDIGKSSHVMLGFFQDLVNQGKLEAFYVEVDKEVVEKNNARERVTRTIKGASLTKTTKLSDNCPYLVKDPKTGIMYHLNIGSHGGMIYDDGDSQTIYHHCVIERLSKFDSKKIRSVSIEYGINIPADMVDARLHVNHDDGWESGANSDYVARTHDHLRVEGSLDGLFEKICEFVRH